MDTQNELVQEAQEKYAEVLKQFKVKKIVSLLNCKARLQEELNRVEREIQEVEKIVAIPEGECLRY